MNRKIGFWSTFALVTGSQIGSGIFMLPISLAPYGIYSLWGWVVSGVGAVVLALVFANLCAFLPKTGGPHIYVQEAFGTGAAFFTGWTYWVISWVSSTAVIVASVGYLTPLIGNHSAQTILILEIILLLVVTAINCKGVRAASGTEILLTLLKILPLLILPILALFSFDTGHFIRDSSTYNLSITEILSRVTLFTLWGFIGLESATTPAESVTNPTKTIPRAIILGTISVAFLYFINSLGIMGAIPGADLMQSKAPYSDVSKIIFGGNWYLVISIIASIVCIGTLNAWVLASGQIALGLAQSGLMPKFFAKQNLNQAPYVSLIICCVGILPLLFLTSNDSLSKQINLIIDFSVVAFLFVYAICSLAFLKILYTNRIKTSTFKFFYGTLALIFCMWVIYETPINTLCIAAIFSLSGIPVYLFWYKKINLIGQAT